MNNTPISILLPVCNAEKYLRNALDSLLVQTHSDFEIIAVDDGSVDCSLQILKEYAHDARIRILSRSNTGIVGALNDAIGMAHGQFLARMDADDIAMSTRLERQIAFLKDRPDCVAVGSSVLIMDEQGSDIHVAEAPTEHAEIEKMFFTGHGALCHPSVMMRAWAVRQVGGYREQYRSFDEDVDLFLRLGEVGELANIGTPLLRYRWHLNSITHRLSPLAAASTRAALIKEACLRRGIPEIDLLSSSPAVVQLSDRDMTIEHYHRWSVEAAKSGRLAIARRYALAALRLEPRRKKCWWVLCNSVLGGSLTGFITRCYHQVRFWRPA
jgi:glycosyltransferase involved in cell wall biosynthesis